MRTLLILLFAPLALLAQVSDSALEDLLTASDGESALPDSIEPAVATFLKPGLNRAGSRDDLLVRTDHFRFQSSFQWTRRSTEKMSWSDTWARTRLTTYSGKRLSSDLLAVRRVDDPRVIDELHLTLAGVHSPSEIAFMLGTYQFDWGLGILSSSAFGAARSLSFFRATHATLGKGVVPRTTSREASWLRGVAVEKRIGKARLAAFGNLREWNANTESFPAKLTGIFSTASASAIDQRDKVEEQSVGGAFDFQTDYVATGLFVESSKFDPVIWQANELRSFSGYGSANWQDIQAAVELSRSGDNSAWMAMLARGTERWRGAFYAMYAAPEYFAPRSQAAFTFGEIFQDSRIIGGRIGVACGVNDFALDIHSNRTPSSLKHSDELTAGWTFIPAGNSKIETRAHFSNSSDDDLERHSFAFRIEPAWTRLLVWSTRLEIRRFSSPDDDVAGSGNYLHVQATRPEGKLRPGLRVALFNLADLDAPMQVYEPAVAGAYPLETFSGDGSRVSGWLQINWGSWAIKMKAALLSREHSSDASEFALAVTFRR